MPGDTLIITSNGDSLRLPDSLFHQQLPAFATKNKLDDGIWFFLVIIGFVLIIAIPFLINWLRDSYRQNQAYKLAEASLKANSTQYDEWLSAYNGYYKSLPAIMRQRFLERVVKFAAAKTITCVNLPKDDKMTLLIGAASVQITFGLDKYLLDFFDTIYIMQHNYNYGQYDKPFDGHVNSNGIYLSWDNFLKGYEDYTDADNVGIHEMAHALTYVNFMAGANNAQDDAFIKRFYDFSAVARPVFNDMQNGKINLLNEYAATNYNEFWAVSVETFFEKSLQMKIAMPELYTSLCKLLNQDPLLPEKILS
ncbi:MAG: zinc-dependent peptidase [Bacteroidota bacterium]